MNHLKLIASNSEKNKVNANVLATIFGPLFVCHYECDNIHKSVQVFKFLLDIWPSKNNTSKQHVKGKLIEIELLSSNQY